MRIVHTRRAKRELAEFKKKFYAGTPPKEGVQQREVLTFEEILAMGRIEVPPMSPTGEPYWKSIDKGRKPKKETKDG